MPKLLVEQVPRAIVFGASNIDYLAISQQKFVAGDSNPGKLHQSLGGVGRNISENLSRLGVPTFLVSVVGDDGNGKRILTESHRVDTRFTKVLSELPTASYTALFDERGELQGAVSDMRIFDELDPSLMPVPQGQNCGAVLLDANLPERVIVSINNGFDFAQMIVAADGVSGMKCRRLVPVLCSLSLLKVNRTEAQILTGLSSDDEDEAMIEKLLGLGVSEVLLTLGDRGAILANSEQQYSRPALESSEIVSANGAGDAMLSAVIAAKLHGHLLEEQLNWGMIAARETLSVLDACCDRLRPSLFQIQD